MLREVQQRRAAVNYSRLYMLPLLGLCLASLGLRCDARAVNVSNTWTMPQEGLNVFYRFFRDRISWFEADAVCQFHHANLVTVDNSFQFDATRDLLRELDVNDIVWIGLMRPQNSDRFMWSNSRPLVADTGYWAESLPLMDAPLCAVIDPIRDYRWHALRCGGPETASFLCEMPVPSWADACILKEMPNLTMQYMADTASIELIRNCQEEGLLRHTCRGKEDRERAIRELICPKERLEAQRINDITNSHFKSLQIINNIRTDNNENNDIELLPLVPNYGASALKIEVATAAPAPSEHFSLDKLMMADEPVSVPQYHIPDEVPMPVKKSAKKVNAHDEYQTKKMLMAQQKSQQQQEKLLQMEKLQTQQQQQEQEEKPMSHLDMMMGDQPALSEEQLPDDVSDSDVSNEILEALPHKKKTLPQDLRTMAPIPEETLPTTAATTTVAPIQTTRKATPSKKTTTTTTTTAVPPTSSNAAPATTTETTTTSIGEPATTTLAAASTTITAAAATTLAPVASTAATTTTEAATVRTTAETVTTVGSSNHSSVAATTTTKSIAPLTTATTKATTEINIVSTTSTSTTTTSTTTVSPATETETEAVATIAVVSSNSKSKSNNNDDDEKDDNINSNSNMNPAPTTAAMPLATSTVSIAHPIHPAQQTRADEMQPLHQHIKETADNSHFIPPMLLVKSHYVPPAKHGEHLEHGEHLLDHGEHVEHRMEHKLEHVEHITSTPLPATTVKITTTPTAATTTTAESATSTSSGLNVAGVVETTTATTSTTTTKPEATPTATKMIVTTTIAAAATTTIASSTSATTAAEAKIPKLLTTEMPYLLSTTTTTTKKTATSNEHSSNATTITTTAAAATQLKTATKMPVQNEDSESEVEVAAAAAAAASATEENDDDEIDARDATTARHNFLQEETEAPFKPNRRRSLTKPETVSYFKKILG